MPRYASVLLIVLAALLELLVAGQASAGSPTDALRAAIDRVIKTLNDPALKAPDKAEERRRAIARITDQIFDWEEAARQSLGLHWRRRTESEREQFVELFRDLLERSYISKIERYRGETIAYVGEAMDGDEATVRTRLSTREGREVPVDYRMLRHGDRWLVYDVIVEHVSLVSNYRTQFNEIIVASSYRELVKRMEAKLSKGKVAASSTPGRARSGGPAHTHEQGA